MGKASRDWTQICAIYGMDEWQTLAFLLLHAAVFSLMSVLFLLYFSPICAYQDSVSLFAALPAGSARFRAGFVGSVTALSAVCLFFAAGNLFYSSGPLRWEISQRMVSAVSDWSNLKTALDVGCGGVGSEGGEHGGELGGGDQAVAVGVEPIEFASASSSSPSPRQRRASPAPIPDRRPGSSACSGAPGSPSEEKRGESEESHWRRTYAEERR